MTHHILYVPLDERACNYDFPARLARMTRDTALLEPPAEWMGKVYRFLGMSCGLIIHEKDNDE